MIRADGGVLRAGRASLYVLERLGWPTWPFRLRPFVWLVELGYRLIADHRHFFSRWLFR